MDVTIWLSFVAASTALLIIPGPTVLMVLSHAIGHGRRVAVSTAAGVALGDFVALTASLAGLGALVMTSATLFTVLKWGGAIYLVYLGVRLIREAGGAALALPGAEGASQRRFFGHAFTVTALNPKSIAFFIAFVPQFVDPLAPLMPQFVILVATFVFLAALNAMTVALAAAKFRDWVGRPAVIAWLARCGGAALIAMGVATAALRRV